MLGIIRIQSLPVILFTPYPMDEKISNPLDRPKLGPRERMAAWGRRVVFGAGAVVGVLSASGCDDPQDPIVMEAGEGDAEGIDSEGNPPIPDMGGEDSTTGDENPETTGDGDGDSGDGDGDPTTGNGDGDGDTGTETGGNPEMWGENAKIDCSKTVEGLDSGGECVSGGVGYKVTVEIGEGIAHAIGIPQVVSGNGTAGHCLDDFTIQWVETAPNEGKYVGSITYITGQGAGTTIKVDLDLEDDLGESPVSLSTPNVVLQ